jgi:hypothetical protein
MKAPMNIRTKQKKIKSSVVKRERALSSSGESVFICSPHQNSIFLRHCTSKPKMTITNSIHQSMVEQNNEQ